jgi:hypothetical protein
VLVAHFLLSHGAALRRDVARLEAVLHEADELPLGSGAIAGTAYAIDVRALAGALGFSRVARNSMDVSGDRDFVSSFLHAASLGMVHLSRIAEDFILFTSEEFGFFELDDRAATGSSLMPQKKNPDPLELVRGKSGRVIGHLTGWLVSMKGLAAGYNKDLQEDKEALFDAEDTVGRVPGARPPPSSPGSARMPRRPRAPRRGCYWRPTSPTISWRKGCRSVTRTKSSARWCAGWLEEQRSFDRSLDRRMAAAFAALRRRHPTGRDRTRVSRKEAHAAVDAPDGGGSGAGRDAARG